MSPTYLSSLAVLIVSVLGILKIQVAQEDILPIITGIAALIILVRRYKIGDLNIIGQKKSK